MTSPSHSESRVEKSLELRAARAEALGPESASAQAPLAFAAGLYRAQAAAARFIAALPELRGVLADDLERFAGSLGGILRHAVDKGPPELAEAAKIRASEGVARLLSWWCEDRSGRTDYLSRALVRPYLEVLAERKIAPEPPAESRGCAVCGGAPWIAVRRTLGDGGQRYLGCALCGSETVVNRIRCARCTEEDPEKLPFFQTERYPAVRLEACLTCHSYIKSIDLTLDARAVPEVDELLSLSMDVWAVDEGYTRIEPGLAGV